MTSTQTQPSGPTFASRKPRMNHVARRERFLVLYPEQNRLAHPQGCWNWFDTHTGRAHGEAALIMMAIDPMRPARGLISFRAISASDLPWRRMEATSTVKSWTAPARTTPTTSQRSPGR